MRIKECYIKCFVDRLCSRLNSCCTPGFCFENPKFCTTKSKLALAEERLYADEDAVFTDNVLTRYSRLRSDRNN